jgi:hypothetical protein
MKQVTFLDHIISKCEFKTYSIGMRLQVLAMFVVFLDWLDIIEGLSKDF